jgi:hypothetical protein
LCALNIASEGESYAGVYIVSQLQFIRFAGLKIIIAIHHQGNFFNPLSAGEPEKIVIGDGTIGEFPTFEGVPIVGHILLEESSHLILFPSSISSKPTPS